MDTASCDDRSSSALPPHRRHLPARRRCRSAGHCQRPLCTCLQIIPDLTFSRHKWDLLTEFPASTEFPYVRQLRDTRQPAAEATIRGAGFDASHVAPRQRGGWPCCVGATLAGRFAFPLGVTPAVTPAIHRTSRFGARMGQCLAHCLQGFEDGSLGAAGRSHDPRNSGWLGVEPPPEAETSGGRCGSRGTWARWRGKTCTVSVTA